MASKAAALLAVLATLDVLCDAYRILVVFPMPGKSHSILGEGHVNLLLDAGHQVTYITVFPMKRKHANLTHVVVDFDPKEFQEKDDVMNIQSLLKGNNVMVDPLALHFISNMIAQNTLTDKNVVKFINDPSQKFDLVLAEWFFSEAYAGFGALFECPFVWFSSVDVHSMVLRLVDEVPNPAYLPDATSYSRPPFSFWQRVQELYLLLKRIIVVEYFIQPDELKLYKERFTPAAAKRGIVLPVYNELIYNASMMLVNGHPSLGDAPKLPQNAKEIGGYHIGPPPPLPEDLQKIMDDSKNGVIYFSMGSNMRSKDLPKQMQRQLLDMFSRFPQTILWKFEETLDGVPQNVHIRSWMPQHSILAHPNTRLFITHGGLLSKTETVYFGVPVVVVPLFGDQFLNAYTATKRGFAVKVDLTYDLAKDLEKAIAEVLNQPKYTLRVKELNRLYHDRLLPPGKEVVYWLEHTVRTGAKHLRSAALSLRWYQRLYLDLLVLVLVTVISVVKLVKVVWMKIFRRKNVTKRKTQ